MKSDPEARQALADLLAGRDPDPRAFEALRAVIVGYLRSAWPQVGEHDAYESSDEALERLLSRASGGRGPTPDEALPYLLRTARNVQVDSFRRRRETPGIDVGAYEGAAVEDRDVLRLLDQAATLSTVRAALAHSKRLGDLRTIHVVSAWLDLAQEMERAPSSRDVGQELGVAHTTVQSALTRFKQYLLAVDHRKD